MLFGVSDEITDMTRSLKMAIGKDLYMGSPILATGKYSGFSVLYRDHRKGPGGPPDGATYPGGPHGLKWRGNHP